MGVFKEEIIDLEQYAKKQVQIYLDSCDYGIRATQSIKNRMREIILSLPNMAKPVWKMDGNTIQRDYRSVVEWGGGDATEVHVLYVNDKLRKKEYFSIDLHAIRVSDDDSGGLNENFR